MRRIPLFKRKSILDLLEAEARRLFIAIVRLESAKNMVKEYRRKKLDSVLIATAMAGLPVSSKDLANMNVNAAYRDVEKALKNIRRVEIRASRELPHLYYAGLKDVFLELNTVLEDVRKSGSVEEMIDKLNYALSLVKDVEEQIASYIRRTQ